MSHPAKKTASMVIALLSTLPLHPEKSPGPEDRILARLNTDKGVIVLELDYRRAPLTTAHFIGLAEGTIDNGVFPPGRPFFNGTKFHRVVPGHVIQAGRPDRQGAEGPDYSIPNEIVPGLVHDRAGVLGMANAGPHTNGSQFYITLDERSYLDGNYTVFGRVVEGLEAVYRIVQGDAISSVDIVRSGPGAAAFRSDRRAFVRLLEDARRRVREEARLRDRREAALIASSWPEALLMPSGARHKILAPGRGAHPAPTDRLRVIYTGRTLSGQAFYSTADEGRPSDAPPAQPFVYVPGRNTLTPALASALASMETGEKRLVIAPAGLAYGDRAFYGRERRGEKRFVIPPGTALVYEVTLLDSLRPDYDLEPVPFTRVSFTDRFWAGRLETNRRLTIPYAIRQCEETGRIRNFETAAALLAGSSPERIFHSRYPFDDSDVYKILEGAAYALKTHPDPGLEKKVDALVSVIAAAQEPDGYLYTARTIFQQNPFVLWVETPERWTDLRWGHELYNAGHLYEAAAAHFQATGKRALLDVALKNADLVASVFGPGKRRGLPGHQEIEIGLVKLYRLTGNKTYLDLARYFVEERGRTRGRESFGEYAQDHKPLTEQTEPVGHAVRAAYYYAGAADIAALTDAGPAAREALETLWRNAVSKKMYITGGIGAAGSIEGFGPDHHLPNATAYCETCASIAMALWSQRMFLLTGAPEYLDVVERLLFNGILSGIGLEGDRFFYPNPLASFGQHRRSPWFACACCPSNVARFIPSLPGFVYARKGSILYVNLFADSRASVTMDDGLEIQVVQNTGYPWDGRVQIRLEPVRQAAFTVAVRIPGWARLQPLPGGLYAYADGPKPTVNLKVNGRTVAVDPGQGWAFLERAWTGGDLIELELPMPVRRVGADERVRENLGRVALERGPIVYCAEGADNSGYVSNLVLPDGSILEPQTRDDLLGGVVVLRGRASALRIDEDGRSLVASPQDFMAVPYYAWAHRSPGEMAVWLARDPSAARPLPRPSKASAAKATASGGREAWPLNDRRDPASSGDTAYPFVHWRPEKGTREWAQYEFPSPVIVSGVEVYWYEGGDCRLPDSWRVLYLKGKAWKPVSDASESGTERDRFNIRTFQPVRTAALRLEFRSREGFSAGIHEWRVR